MKSENVLSKIEHFAEQVRDDYLVPGLAVAIVQDNEIILARGFGERRLSESQAVDENTLFGIASISKSFTALTLGMLVDEGQLNWNDPVTRYLPSFLLYDAYATRELTVLDLLIHRCGLAQVSGGTVWYGSDFNRQEVIDRIRYLKPVSSFRSEYAYQNITYLLAGEIVQVITGQSWDDFVMQRIFTPLEMHTSNTSIKAFNAESNVAHPHALVDGHICEVPPRSYDNVGPAASVNSSVWELSAYARLLLNGGEYQGHQLYSPEIARALWTPRTLIPLVTDFPPELDSIIPQFHNAYALGWVIQDAYGQKRVSHSGGIDGLRSLLTLIPQQNLGVIVCVNNEGRATWTLTNIILDLYFGADPDAWYDAAQDHWQEQLKRQIDSTAGGPIAGTVPSLELERYAGKFTSELIGDIVVNYEEGQLILRFPHTPAFTASLSHWHYDTFKAEWQDPLMSDGLLTFVMDARGQISELRLDQRNLLDVDFSELHPIKRSGL